MTRQTSAKSPIISLATDVAIRFLLLSVLSSCGVQGQKSTNRSDFSQSADLKSADQSVRACKLPGTGSAGLNGSLSIESPYQSRNQGPQLPILSLQGTTYTGSLYPILQNACSECHKPSIENRQNSTNCYYIRDNLDSVIKRLKNARDAQAFKAANQSATNDAINNRYPRQERPMPPIDKTPLTEAEIALFESWKGVANPCGEADQILQEEVIAKPKTHSAEEEEKSVQNLNKLFATASCEDGPEINTEESWKLMDGILKHEPTETDKGKFYDFFERKYLDDVVEVKESCTMEGLLGLFADVPSMRDALSSHAAYGWKVVQCGGKKRDQGQVHPMITIGSLSRVTTSIGDFIYGVNLKTIEVKLEGEK